MRELGSFRNFGRGRRRLVSGHGRSGGFFSRTPGPPPFDELDAGGFDSRSDFSSGQFPTAKLTLHGFEACNSGL
jgi:hypothetical protein